MQNKNKTNFFDIILNIILILLAILIVYWFIQLILGGSPEVSEINFVLIMFMGGFLVKLYREVGEIKIEMKYFSSGIKESFNKIKGDMDLIKEELKI